MALISQETWDNMPGDEKKSIIKEYEKLKEETQHHFVEFAVRARGAVERFEKVFGKENLQSKPQIKTWEDIENAFPDTYGNEFIRLYDFNEFAWEADVTRKCIAALMISKIIELGYGGQISNKEWEDCDVEKWCIIPRNDEFSRLQHVVFYFNSDKRFIAFHTEQQAKEFMSYESNKKLIELYHMM